MTTAPLLEVRNMDSGYGPSRIIQNLSFTLDSGMMCLIGRNGMGKSTLLKSIMGLVKVTKGSVLLQGKDITNRPSNEIGQRGIGYCPQGRYVFSRLTVDEQLHFIERNPLKKTEGLWNADRVYELFPRLKERADNKGSQLSGGEQQMLAIGRALTTNPALLLLDEPSEGLAPVVLDRIRLFMDDIMESGIAILLVEQNIPFVRKVTDDITVLMVGDIVYQGSLKELLKDKALTEKYLVAGS